MHNEVKVECRVKPHLIIWNKSQVQNRRLTNIHRKIERKNKGAGCYWYTDDDEEKDDEKLQ